MIKEGLNSIEEMLLHLKGYINTSIELVKLNAAAKISKILSNFIAVLFVAALILLFVFFASFAMAFLVGDWLGKTWLGFLVIALFYLLVALITWFARERLLRIPILNSIIRQLFGKDQDGINTGAGPQ